MSKTIAKLDEILSDKINVLQEKGIIYLMIIIAVIIAIFIIYDRDNSEPKVFNSFSRSIRRFLVLASDVTSDIISIFSSLTEILNLIRILVFGKIDSQTQIFLANYAIIFMSVVSYFTTMNGLKLILEPWQAILASFGIQVGILVFSSRLSQLLADKHPDTKKTCYIFRIKEDQNNCSCDCEKGEKECSKVLIKRNNKIEETENINNTRDSKKKNWWDEMKGILFILPILVPLMICSSFFSYNAFWEKFVLPGVPMNEYVTARVIISDAEEDYSNSLKEYQQQLENVLYEVNNKILETVDVNPINLLEIQIQNKDVDIEALDEQIQAAEDGLEEFEVGSAEYNRADDEITNLRNERNNLISAKNSLEEQLYSDYVYRVNESINYLSAFYAAPLNEEISIADAGSHWVDLQSTIAQIEETKELFTTEERSNLDVTVNNYLELCSYYRANGFAGFKIKELISSEEQSITEDDSEEYEQETRIMLLNAIKNLEEAPNFVAVNSIRNNSVIEETSKTRLLEKLYTTFRDSSGQVQTTEKAIRSLFSLTPFLKTNSEITQRSKGIVFFVLILAIFIDCTIVAISIWKGNKSTNRSFSELRRLVGILFIKKEKSRDEKERRMQLSIAFGLLFGVFMFVLQQLIPSINTELNDRIYWLFFMYCACGILAAIIIGKAIGRAQNTAKDCEADSEEENNTEYLSECDDGSEKENNTERNVKNQSDSADENVIKQYLQPTFIKIFDQIERKTICIINTKTYLSEKEKNVACIKVSEVIQQNWYIEFSILESYKIISISENNEYYIIKDIFWKMLYTNILNKMSGNLMLPMSVEDLINYEDSDENNN